jgi:nucleolysin TIA-1/TIAR
MSDETHPRILYVGNLDSSVTEELLVTLFGQLGSCKGCKLIHEAGNDLYAFVEFAEHRDAQLALLAMNKRIVLGREMKVNWATSPGSTSKMDTSKHFHVFVGDISPDIESHQLREAFAPFGVISDCKVIRDPQTHKSKGYGFVCFVNKEDAEMAIVGMNGQWLGGRPLRTNWATGKGLAGQRSSTQQNRRELDYDEVYNQTGATNSTVYCGGILSDLTEEVIREHFGQFGTVQDIRVFKDKGFAFIRMDSKDAATRAIIATHGSQINGYSVKSSWGKDMAADSSSGSQQPSAGSGAPPRPPMPPQQPYYGGTAPYYNYWGGYGMPGYGPVPPAAPYGMPYYGGYPPAPYGAGMPQMQWPGGPAPPAGQPPNGQGQQQTNNGQ